MAENYSFSVMPSVGISRSKFNRKSQHKTSFNLGMLVPIYCDEVLPGDTRSFDMASLVRMSTPIAPIMDNIYLDLFAFFVPNRLSWIHWKDFMGENNASAGIPSVSYSVPQIEVQTGLSVQSLTSYFGLPITASSTYKVSALPFRAYCLIYNRWFRNQNIIAPLAVNTGDSDGAIIGNNSTGFGGPYKAAKLPDYFTSGLPYAQKGGAVSIPLGSTAPIKVKNNTTGAFGPDNALSFTGSGTGGTLLAGATDPVGSLIITSTQTKSSGVDVFADLSQATAATINQLRYAFQLQKLLEKDALYGTRYWEILAAHFGVHAPDASLQDPEYLGGHRIHINVDQVLSTAGYQAGNTTTVGAPGANSVSGDKCSLFTKSFVEHGYIIICAVARHDQTYSQGVNRMWSRTGRYDFYWPVFANLGAQEVKLKELYVQGTTVDDNVFGYQEAWAEYRYKPSISSGYLNPNVSGALEYWTLSNKFTAAPTLGQTFIEQDRSNIQRALVTGSTGPDFIADFYFMDTAVRPMPVYSVPGLIDHH